mgnify:FL=1
MPDILVIDDDPGLRDLLAEYLAAHGFHPVTASDGPTGLAAAEAGGHDLVVLDIMLPGMDGLSVLRELRTKGVHVPVIMLTARGDEVDRIVGLEIGADDYLSKPFNPRELVARIQAVLRRSQAGPSADGPLRAGPLTVDPDRRSVTLAGTEIDLTTTEFELLRVLVQRAGRVVPREQLMELARGEAYAAFDRSVDVHISHLRRKLGDPPRQPRLIKTVRGVGYTVPTAPSWPPPADP